MPINRPKKTPVRVNRDFLGVSHSTAIANTVKDKATIKTAISWSVLAVSFNPTSKKAVEVTRNKNRKKYNNSMITPFNIKDNKTL
jgi:hypothetical protein